MRPSARLGVLQGPPDAARRGRAVEALDSERGQGVEDGIGDGGKGGDRPGLAPAR